MAYLSITRLKLRSPRYLPQFTLHTIRSVLQVQQSPGFIRGEIITTFDLSGWTALLWTSEAAIQAYVTTGAHTQSAKYLKQWAAEAVQHHYRVDHLVIPSWAEITHYLCQYGRFFSLPYGSQHHTHHIVLPTRLIIFKKSFTQIHPNHLKQD